MFSQTADYALRVVAHLASQDGRQNTIGDMAEAVSVNAPYLRKVFDKLRDAGLVEAQRGSGGGVRLLADPAKLTLLEVVNAIDPIRHIEGCPLGLPGHLELCALHSELEQAITQVEQLLGGKTFDELLQQRQTTRQCSFPREHILYHL